MTTPPTYAAKSPSKWWIAVVAFFVFAGIGNFFSDDDKESGTALGTTSTTTSSGLSDPEVTSISGRAGLQAGWDGRGSAEQELLCYGWNMDAQQMIDSFYVTASRDIIPEEMMVQFYEEKCA